MTTMKIKFCYLTRAQRQAVEVYYAKRQEKPIGNLNQQFIKINPRDGSVIIDV